MTQATEYTLVEKPCIDALVKLGYTWLPPQQNRSARDTLNQVIVRHIFITAIQHINDARLSWNIASNPLYFVSSSGKREVSPGLLRTTPY